MEIYKKNWFKYIAGLVVCLLARLIPFRAPNVEPILATQMPFSKAYGKTAGFLFGFLSIMLYDIVTWQIGAWTLITSSAYGLLGLFATVYFKNKKNSAWNYAKFAIMGTLFFDAVTGLSVGPLIFHQSFSGALLGQIPFTLLHLLGNVSFALFLSPAIYNLLIKNKKSENFPLINVLYPKTIQIP
ncbi:MAG: ECF transporter S component [Patescibacteria group bacterium]